MNVPNDNGERNRLLLAQLALAIRALCARLNIENCGLDNPELVNFLLEMIRGEL